MEAKKKIEREQQRKRKKLYVEKCKEVGEAAEKLANKKNMKKAEEHRLQIIVQSVFSKPTDFPTEEEQHDEVKCVQAMRWIKKSKHNYRAYFELRTSGKQVDKLHRTRGETNVVGFVTHKWVDHFYDPNFVHLVKSREPNWV